MIHTLRQLIVGPGCRGSARRKANVINRFMRWRQRRKDLELVLSLPDYLLKDIGLSRRMAEEAVRGRHDGLPANSNFSGCYTKKADRVLRAGDLRKARRLPGKNPPFG